MEVQGWIHAFMEDANDLDGGILRRAIENDMHWIAALGTAMPCIAEMKATDTRQQIVAISRGGAPWVRSDRPERCVE
jgi:hypothetical protein